jgi:hypothetical protein
VSELLVVSIVALAVISGTGCGRYRQHVYRNRIPGHYAAYDRNRKHPQSGDTLELKDDGSCLHSFLKPGEKNLTEEPCTWALTDKFDGSWLRFEDLSGGIHSKVYR